MPACHSIEAGKNLIGPSLAGIFGKPAGKNDSFNYSSAMKGSGVTWDAASLHAFLQAPQKFVPKKRSSIPGIQLESERTNVIAYLAASAQNQNAAPVATAPATARDGPMLPPARGRAHGDAAVVCKFRVGQLHPRRALHLAFGESPTAAWSISALAARSTVR